MSAFTPVGPDGGPIDTTKAVRYVDGMVLGVGDFQQEHAYLTGLAWDALRHGAGVGTLWGLKVAAPPATPAGKFEVHVGPGAALDSRGRIVRVPEEQCADLKVWFDALPPATVLAKVGGLPATLAGALTAFVTLAYEQVETDLIPVPGEPCRTDAQLTAASRLRDDYRLNVALDPPPTSRWREGLRQFLTWTTYAITFTEANPVPEAQWNTKIEAAATLLAESAKRAVGGRLLPTQLVPPAPPGPTLPNLTAVTVNRGDVELQARCLEAASAILVTELLPDWVGPAPTGDSADALLLAELTVGVKRTVAGANWAFDGLPPKVSARGRMVALAGPTLRLGPRLP